MAASCRTFLLPFPSYRLKLLSQSAHRATYSQCQAIYIRQFSNAHDAHETRGCHITRDSCVDKTVSETLETHHVGVSGHVNYRKHPGVMRCTRSSLPTRLVKAIKVLMEKYPVPSLVTKTDKLVKYLYQRQPPLNDAELALKAKEIENDIFSEEGDKFGPLSEEELPVAIEAHRKRVLSKLRKNVYHWKPMQYDAFTSYIYLLGRMASDYAVQLQCFTEISKRDPDFKPTSVFYHGSRVGAGVWASNEIWQTIGEHYCVDECTHMNTIARLLLQDGNEQERVMSISGTHFRNFAPSPKQNKFSLVVSAYDLMEQPSPENRAQLVQDLWEMAQGYLVLIEVGTGAGFKLVDEARQVLLQLSGSVDSSDPLHGHVFAPCPHDKLCPKVVSKNQLCLSECTMKDVDFTKKTMPEKGKSNLRYSYLIMKKGPRTSVEGWPRVLQRVKAQRHTHCHLCLPSGELQHVIISKAKYERHLYSCARHLDQGDFLPVTLTPDPGQVTGREPGVNPVQQGEQGSGLEEASAELAGNNTSDLSQENVIGVGGGASSGSGDIEASGGKHLNTS